MIFHRPLFRLRKLSAPVDIEDLNSGGPCCFPLLLLGPFKF